MAAVREVITGVAEDAGWEIAKGKTVLLHLFRARVEEGSLNRSASIDIQELPLSPPGGRLGRCGNNRAYIIDMDSTSALLQLNKYTGSNL